MEIAYTIYCCITNYCKIWWLKTKSLVSEGQESLAICFWLGVSLEFAVKLLAGLHLYRFTGPGESVSKLTQGVLNSGPYRFTTIIPVLCWLLAGVALHILPPVALLILQPAMTQVLTLHVSLTSSSASAKTVFCF